MKNIMSIFVVALCINVMHINALRWTKQSHGIFGECVHLFEICLKNLNTPLSNDVAFVHSINATKCYSIDHPIVKCIKFETYSDKKGPLLRFMNLMEREKYFNRCINYEFDESRPKEFQIFDVPFNDHAMSTARGMFYQQKQILFLCFFVFLSFTLLKNSRRKRKQCLLNTKQL